MMRDALLPTADDRERFARDGAILLKGLFKGWVEPLRQGIADLMAHPSPLERSYHPEGDAAPFFQDLCNWQRFADFRRFVFESPAAGSAARLMGSRTARFFHDHVLVKEPGTSVVTPWHQDQPYYCVEGRQTVSFWIPLDAVPRENSLECVAGSHQWGIHKPKRFDGTDLYQDDKTVEMPDIARHRADYRVPRLGHGARGRGGRSTFVPCTEPRPTPPRPNAAASSRRAGWVTTPSLPIGRARARHPSGI